jgi:Zn-dependent metalloprotease
MSCSIIPPYLLQRIAQLDDPRFSRAQRAAAQSLALERPYSPSLLSGEPAPPTDAPPRPTLTSGGPSERARRRIFDAHGTEDLPGDLVRDDGTSTEDVAVDEAWDGLGATHELFRAVYDRASIDDAGMVLDATVHYGRNYDNAFWNGERMVFGDGDDEVFRRMTASVSVIGHELTHGVTQYTAGLAYEGQSGALNESVSDVFGALVEQYAAAQTVEQASWLIGYGLFTDAVEGSAIRSMKAPGTAYDDDVLGTDPQPDHMDRYIVTRDDNGGVHLNSGIPNRAFYLTASALGGHAWEHAGRIWYDTLTGPLVATASFADFATATTDAATARYGTGSDEAVAVASAWRTVGVL